MIKGFRAGRFRLLAEDGPHDSGHRVEEPNESDVQKIKKYIEKQRQKVSECKDFRKRSRDKRRNESVTQTDGERGGTLLSNMRIKTNRTGRMEAEKDGGEEPPSLHINVAFRCSSEALTFRDFGHEYNKYIFFLCEDKHPDSVC